MQVAAVAVQAPTRLLARFLRGERTAIGVGGLEAETVMLGRPTMMRLPEIIGVKLTGKRLFRMAPLHHHFELKGWAEPKVIVRFWIVSVILVLAGLATLKIR